MKEIIVLDLETTGLDERKDSIIEIAAVRLENSKIVDKFQALVKPAKNVILTPTIMALTGITDKDLEDAVDLSEIKDELIKFVGDRPIMGHNIGFDLDFLKANDINLPGEGLDTIELSQTLLPKLSFYNLGYLANHYNFSNLPTHRAMSDVLATAELYDLILSVINSLSDNRKQQIKSLLPKSSWDWSFIFQENTSSNKSYTRNKEVNFFQSAVSEIAKVVDIKSLKPGFNLFELPPDLEQTRFNIALAKNMDKSVLVVNNNLFYGTDWSELGFNMYHPSSSLVDKKRFEFMLSKNKLSVAELKIAIKILVYGFDDKDIFIPGNIFLTKDEFYLFEQKLIPLEHQSQELLDRSVISFSAFQELLQEDKLLKDKTILTPQWVEFDDWMLERNAKLITSAYLNAVVSSRRDFVHDFVGDHQLADNLFKILNELGTHLVMTMAMFGMVWQEQQRGSISVVDFEESFFNTKNGVGLKGNLQGIISFLKDYSQKIEKLDIDPLVLNRQIIHTNELIEYFQLVLNPSQTHKIYLDVVYNNMFLRIVKEEPGNVWQDSLKQLTTVIASNGILVEGKNDFASTILREPVPVQTIPSQTTQKELIFIHDLPNSKGPNYQKQISQYIKHWIEKEPGKSLVIMPTVKMVEEFFNDYQPTIQSVELLSRKMIGNSPVLLKAKLDSLDRFALLTGYYDINRVAPAISGLDRISFIRLSFDPPGKISQLLAKDRISNVFIDYALPKAVVKFKTSLASLFNQTTEFWVLDDRILGQQYGRMIKNSLKGYKQVELSEDN